jgi:hypothetical protein
LADGVRAFAAGHRPLARSTLAAEELDAGARRWPSAGFGRTVGIADVSGNLLSADVVPAAGGTRFLVRSCGARILEFLGLDRPTPGQGRFIDEALPPAYRNAALSTFREAVAAREPVYTVADMRDGGGRIVHFERLLLPCGQDGTSVDRVLASIEAVSPEGAFESRDLMAASPPAFAFCAVIDTRGHWPG